MCGNSHARAAPSISTSTMYSGISRSVMRPRISTQRVNAVAPDPSPRLGAVSPSLPRRLGFLRRDHAVHQIAESEHHQDAQREPQAHPVPAEHEAHEDQRGRIQHGVAEPERDRRARRRLTRAQARHDRRRAAGAHHARQRHQAAVRPRCRSRVLPSARATHCGGISACTAEPSKRPSTIACQIALP